jgi:hypothetical protein
MAQHLLLADPIVISESQNSDAGNGFDLPAGSTLIVEQGVTVSSSANDFSGIATASGAATGMTIKGSVIGYYGISSLNSQSWLTVERTGTITGHFLALNIIGAHTVQNFGTIVSSEFDGIDASGGSLTLINNGLIRGRFAVRASNVSDHLTNENRIEGQVQLKRGDDTYDGRLGFAVGLIDLGEGNDTAWGGAGSEEFGGGSGDDLLDGGGGADWGVFDVSGASITIDLNLTGPQSTGNGLDTILNIENIRTAGGSDHLIGNGADNIFQTNNGNDTIDGGGGNKTAIFRGDRSHYQVTQANGIITVEDKRPDPNNDGVDQLKNIRVLKFADVSEVLYNTAPEKLTLSTTTIAENAGVDTIVATFSAVDAQGDALTWSLTDPSGTFKISGNSLVLAKALDFEAGQRAFIITVEAKDKYEGKTTQSFTLDVANVIEKTGLTLIGTAGDDLLTGEAGDDLIYGRGGNDVLRGEAGNDKLWGELGNDTLLGGAGADIFVFDQKLARTNTANKRYNLDKIGDFSRVDDTIHLAKSVFSKIAKKGVLQSKEFYASTKSQAHDASDRIIYNKQTGALLYDKDGTGAAAAIQFATIAKNLKGFSHLDFFVI